MKKIISVLLLTMASVSLSGQLKTGYEIGITLRGLEDSTVYLAYHLGDKQYIRDTIKLNNSASSILEGSEALPQGIYMIVLPGRKYFEFLVSDDQYFSLNCDYSDYFNTLNFKGSEENTAFVEYQKRWFALQQKASSIAKRIQENKQNPDSLTMLTSVQKQNDLIMKSFLQDVVKTNNDNLLAALVKSLIPIEVPNFTVPITVQNPDSVRWILNYNYNKDHFFDNIDLTDERLLRTPILYARLNTFFTNIVIQSADSINIEIDKIIRKCSQNYKVFQFISVFLFNHFRESQIMGHDAVLVKLADEIYLSGKADWVSNEFKSDLRKQIELIRPNLIGKTAENLVMDSYKGIFVSLDDVDKDFTILYFWEPNCGHCLEATPLLKEFYAKPRDYSLEVFAICTTDEKDKWSKYIEENKLSWINGWDPDRSTHFDYYYNVQSTPLVYILDKNKKIIAKKISVGEIGSFIDNYRTFVKR